MAEKYNFAVLVESDQACPSWLFRWARGAMGQNLLSSPEDIMRIDCNTNAMVHSNWNEGMIYSLDELTENELVFIYFDGTHEQLSDRVNLSFGRKANTIEMVIAFHDATYSAADGTLINLAALLIEEIERKDYAGVVVFGKELSLDNDESSFCLSIKKIILNNDPEWFVISATRCVDFHVEWQVKGYKKNPIEKIWLFERTIYNPSSLNTP